MKILEDMESFQEVLKGHGLHYVFLLDHCIPGYGTKVTAEGVDDWYCTELEKKLLLTVNDGRRLFK